MVLELLANPGNAERKPWELFFIGMVYSSVALLSALLVFRNHAGIAMVFFTTLGCAYFVQKLLKMEEKKDHSIRSELEILKEHGKALSVFVFLFLGFVFAFMAWYIILPAETSHQVFGVHEQAIQCVNNPGAQGCVTGTTESFFRILFNNFRGAAADSGFCLLLRCWRNIHSCLERCGCGYGNRHFYKERNWHGCRQLRHRFCSILFRHFFCRILRYMTHGVFEIAAYFMAALAGGIISIAIARHDFRSPEFRKVLMDSVDVTALAFGVLFLAAVIEVFVTPLFF